MRVGILTFTYGDNYGQRLQNLAMQEFLKGYFDEVYTIKQIPPRVGLKRIFEFEMKTLLTGKRGILRKRHISFEQFNSNYISFYSIPISEKTIDLFPEKQFDYFVCGSDQVWSPYSPDVNSTMFLNFTNKEKRIALCPSIAAESIPDEKKALFKQYFEGFRYISTREYAGSDLVKKISGKVAYTLTDPTLMFDDHFWNKYTKEPQIKIPQHYALCYFLGSDEDIAEINRVCIEKKLMLINLMNDKILITMGPSEFIYLIKNADLVYTDSYHGTIFSIIFETPFVVCERKGTSLNMNSRFETLFYKLDIPERRLGLVKDNDLFDISFANIKIKIQHEQEKFKEFYKKNIS